MASIGVADSESVWAERVSRRLLEPLGARWRHTTGVVKRARVVGAALERGDSDVLMAAAFLHDIGYAPELAQTGFHPVDGARFVRACGYERLAGLVAFHSASAAEAGERELLGELSEFEDERSLLSRTLTYCDLTTDREGRLVESSARIAEVHERYGSEAPEARALECSETALLDDVRTVESMLAENGRDLGLAGSERRWR
ncbi:MAG: HD domain-containing protein [Solirubrobacteraceae bacterium]